MKVPITGKGGLCGMSTNFGTLLKYKLHMQQTVQKPLEKTYWSP